MTAAACPRCGRTTWQRHGGMGGGIVPDAETHCLQMSGMWCRVAAAGYAAGRRSMLPSDAERAALAVAVCVLPCSHERCAEGLDWLRRVDAAKGEP